MRAFRYAAIICLLASAGYLITRTTSKVSAQTSAGCDATTLNSSYGFSKTGQFYADGYGYLPLSGNGRLQGDGNGNITGFDTILADGTVYKRTFTGTYTVNADCSGTVSLTFSDQTNMHGDIVIVNDGKEVLYNDTDTDFIYHGSWIKINQGATAPAPTTSVDQTAVRR